MTYGASANTPKGNGGFVRLAGLCVKRSELSLPAPYANRYERPIAAIRTTAIFDSRMP